MERLWAALVTLVLIQVADGMQSGTEKWDSAWGSGRGGYHQGNGGWQKREGGGWSNVADPSQIFKKDEDMGESKKKDDAMEVDDDNTPAATEVVTSSEEDTAKPVAGKSKAAKKNRRNL